MAQACAVLPARPMILALANARCPGGAGTGPLGEAFNRYDRFTAVDISGTLGMNVTQSPRAPLRPRSLLPIAGSRPVRERRGNSCLRSPQVPALDQVVAFYKPKLVHSLATLVVPAETSGVRVTAPAHAK